MKNRYEFFKKLYPEYVIAFENKNKLKSLGIDKYLLEYIKNKDINYIIVNQENNIEIHSVLSNCYKIYVLKLSLKNLLNQLYTSNAS